MKTNKVSHANFSRQKALFTLCLLYFTVLNSLFSQTSIFKDIQANTGNSHPFYFGKLKNVFLFMATTDAEGTELWASDGTASGTFPITEVAESNAGSGFVSYYLDTNTLLFSTVDYKNEKYLWISDGTIAGTRKLTAFFEYPPWQESFFKHNGKYYFEGSDSSGRGLWCSDGTPEGTKSLLRLDSTRITGRCSYFMPYGNRFYFLASTIKHGSELWVSDGSTMGTHMVSDFRTGQENGMLTKPFKINDDIIFTGQSDSSGYQVFRYNITSDTFYKYYPIFGNKALSLIAQIDSLYFLVNSYGVYETFVTNGTEKGTYRMQSKDTSIHETMLNDVFTLGNKSVCNVYSRELGSELWLVDSTYKIFSLIMDISPGINSSQHSRPPIIKNGKMYFLAFNIQLGLDFWVTDGTFENTRVYYELTPQQSVRDYFEFNGKFYVFGKLDPKYGDEIYLFDDFNTSLDNQDLETKGLIPFPNPITAGQTLRIQSESACLNLSLYNAFGQMIQQENQSCSLSLLPDLSPGIYHIRVSTEFGTMTYPICVQ